MAKNNLAAPTDPLADHPHQEYHRLRVARIINETADACSVVFDVPDDLIETYRYKAGQFLTLKIPYEGKQLVRCYSLASSPDCETEHKVTIKRIADGRISNWINDNLFVGDTVEVLPPGGRFTLNKADNPLVLFSGGSGITPVISLIKTALASTERSLKLVYANADEASIIFRDELQSLAARYENRLEVIHSLDSIDRFLDTEAVRRHIADRQSSEFFVCGPAAFMDIVEAALQDEGIDPSAIHIEKFISPPDPDDVAMARADEAAALAGDEAPEFLTVELDGETHQVPYQAGQTVLVACQDAGLEPPWSCTDGFCGSCMASLTEGEVKMINNDFLSDEELEEGWILTCQSVPISLACKLEYPA